MTKRIIFLDRLRAFATVGVVIIHTVSPVITHLDLVHKGVWWVSALCESVFYAAVPLFVMISGALLLPHRVESVSTFYRKRLLRIVPPALFYFAVYGWWSLYTRAVPDIKTYLIRVFVYGTPYTHLYYVYIIFGLYVITPWFRVLVKHISKRELFFLTLGLLGITAYWNFTVGFVTRNWIGTYLSATTLFIPYLGYYLLGFMLYSHRTVIKRSVLLGLIALVAGMLVLSEYILQLLYGATPRGLLIRDYANPLIVFLAAGLFTLFSSMRQTRQHLFLSKFSEASYGIYLCHLLIIEGIFRGTGLTSNTLTIPLMALIVLVVLVGSFGMSLLLAQIPGFKIFSGVKH